MGIVTTGTISITDVNDALISVLSQVNHLVPTETDGSGGDFSAANTTLTVFLGQVDDTSNWTVSATPSSGVVGGLVGTTYSVSDLSVDAGHVDLIATRAGFPDLTNRFSLSKAKRGVAGPALSIVASSSAFTFVDGLPIPTDQSISLTLVRQNSVGTAVWYIDTGTPVDTDLNRFSVGSYMMGVPNGGVGDTCYIPLSSIAGVEQIYVTAVVGNQTATYCINRSNKSTAVAGATRNVFRGSRAISGTSWSDSEANAAVLAAGGGVSNNGDVVTLFNTTAAFSETRLYTGSAWTPLAAFFGGDILVDGTVTADKIVANSITARHLFISDNANILAGSESPTTSGFKVVGINGTFATAPTFNSRPYSLRLNVLAVGDGFKLGNLISVTPGDKYYLACQAYANPAWNGTSANSKIRISDSSDNLLGALGLAITDFASTATWYLKSMVFTVPAGVYQIGISLRGDATLGSAALSDLVLRKMTDASLIVDGAVLSTHLNTTSMGVAGLAVFGGTLQSTNFVTGVSGWKIDNAGNAEVNSLVVRTDMIASDALSTIREYNINNSTVYSAGTTWNTVGTIALTPSGAYPLSFWMTAKASLVLATGVYGSLSVRLLWRGVAMFTYTGVMSGIGAQTVLNVINFNDRFPSGGSTTDNIEIQIMGTSGDVNVTTMRILIGEFKR